MKELTLEDQVEIGVLKKEKIALAAVEEGCHQIVLAHPLPERRSDWKKQNLIRDNLL